MIGSHDLFGVTHSCDYFLAFVAFILVSVSFVELIGQVDISHIFVLLIFMLILECILKPVHFL
uniref:Uncharacterized protein n=1 Tax=Anguilla anguilla TaxID=7936 RepID=A0A0E9UE93_ANGAN